MSDNIQRTLVFGEVLFDHFPDGQRVLGGAPFNVAWNLQGMGVRPLFVSAVGSDAEGIRIREGMDDWGMDASGLQVLDDRATGNVQVSFVDGQPEYEIAMGQAWDFIGPVDPSLLDQDLGMLYHGSLALRGERSLESWRQLVKVSGLPRFVDINIREPFFDARLLPEMINGASWVKLNDEELERITGVAAEDEATIKKGLRVLRDKYDVNQFLVTCGSKGAFAITESDVVFAPTKPPADFKDTVGAGDAFASAVIAGLSKDIPLSELLPAAVAFAGKVCGLNGATSKQTDLYRSVFD